MRKIATFPPQHPTRRRSSTNHGRLRNLNHQPPPPPPPPPQPQYQYQYQYQYQQERRPNLLVSSIFHNVHRSGPCSSFSSFSSFSSSHDENGEKTKNDKDKETKMTYNNDSVLNKAETETETETDREVSKFSRMNASWWDATQNPLLAMNAVRVQYMMQQLEQHQSASASASVSASASDDYDYSILDVGCGGGILCESLARLLCGGGSRYHHRRKNRCSTRIVGIDLSQALIDVAHAHAATTLDPEVAQCLEYRHTSVESLAAEKWVLHETLKDKNDDCDDNHDPHHSSSNNNLFNVVCLLEVVEHLASDAALHSMLDAITSVMCNSNSNNSSRSGNRTGSDSILFVSTLNRTIPAYLGGIVAAEHVFHWLPKGTHAWHQFQSPTEFAAKARRHNLVPIHVCGIVPASTPTPTCGVPIPIPPFFTIPHDGPSWNWTLDPHNVSINWIGAYRKV